MSAENLFIKDVIKVQYKILHRKFEKNYSNSKYWILLLCLVHRLLCIEDLYVFVALATFFHILITSNSVLCTLTTKN